MNHEFDLPIGYRDQNGETHRRVVMRRPLTGDFIAVANDIDVRDLAKGGRDISLPTEGFDPLKTFLARAAVIHLRSVLFSRIVEQLGTISRPNRQVFRSLEVADFERLEDEYDRLIAVKTSEDQTPETGEAAQPGPFASTPSAS